LASRIRQLLKDHELRERLGQQAIRWAGRYGWPVIADQILELYEQARPVAQPSSMQAQLGQA
jgi:glycosyltransferase involved in cell wall biosynthesis